VGCVHRGARVFWLLVGALAGAATYFGVGAESRRREIQSGTGVHLETGQSVAFEGTIDGDSVMVRTREGGRVVVRLLGVQAFSPKSEKDPASAFGRAAATMLTETLSRGSITVLLGDPPRDRHGRHLARLMQDGFDVGRSLIRTGLVLAYFPTDFDDMDAYLADEMDARTQRRGLWGHPVVAERAERLVQGWKDDPP
jgi:endonuclease YncB( thermonuclease family)